MLTVAKRQIMAAVAIARRAGARISSICNILEVSDRTLQRWQQNIEPDKRKASVRTVQHKLTDSERKRVIEIACSSRFKDLYPSEIVAVLAQEGTYIASESTFYRILRDEKLLSHRRKSKPPVKREKPRLKATAPEQLFSWDITWLKTEVAGIYFYLYLVVDVFSRKIMQWEIHTSESSVQASAMLNKLAKKNIVKDAILHSDNGSPMKGLDMLATMKLLGVMPSFSRPHVSTDNPYSEALFKTLKYRPSYPNRFSTIEEAREWVHGFVYWYNREHMHSGISFVTPHERHYGQDKEILKRRRETYLQAYKNNPSRWSTRPKTWARQEVVYINPVDENKDMKLAS